MEYTNTETIELVIQRFAGGDESAKGELIGILLERFRQTASKLMKRNPKIRRWEATDDVLQQAMIRLSRCLDKIKPDSARHLFALAQLQISRELTDMARKHYGPCGIGNNHATRGAPAHSDHRSRHDPNSDDQGPDQLLDWMEFQRAIDDLKEPYRSVFRMAWYQMLTPTEMAAAMECSTRTIRRHLRTACVMLKRAVEHPPGVNG